MLVVWKLERLGRNLAHLVNTVQDLDTLKAVRALEASGIQPEQAEAIVQAIRSSREAPVSRFDLDVVLAAMTYQLRDEIKATVRKKLPFGPGEPPLDDLLWGRPEIL